MPRRVFGVAASAGGVEPLRRLVGGLPANLDAAVCVVLHIPPMNRSVLATILARETPLTVVVGEHGAPLHRGTVYVAPPDHHLLVRSDRIELSRGPKQNGVRPAADPLLRSIAHSWGRCGAAVILSGALDDGAAGAVAISQAGGTVLVQDPEDALVPGMPSATVLADSPARILPAHELAGALRQLAEEAAPDPEEEPVAAEPDPAEVLRRPTRPDGPASGFTCPECNGALWESQDGELLRYRCRVGHTYSEAAMVEAQGSAVEAALWAALEVLEERAELMRKVALRHAGRRQLQSRFEDRARDADTHAAAIRRVLATSSHAEPVAR